MTMRETENRSESPIFIVGRPRSGTTLMGTLLDAHPRISILPIETELFMSWFNFPDHNLTQKESEQFCHQFEASEEYRKLEIPLSVYKSAVDRRSLTRTVRSILNLLGERDAAHHNKSRWGEKTPLHYMSVNRIFEAFPQARVIIMVRDPRAILASLLKAPWNIETPEKSARSWNYLAHVVSRWSSDNRVLPVAYERLVTETVPVLREICTWLGEQYSDAMLDRTALTHRLEKDRGWGLQHRRKTMDKITAESVDRWKSELEPGHIRLVEHLCGKNMNQFGYHTLTEGLAFYPSIILEIKHLLRRTGSRLQYEKKRLQRKLSAGSFTQRHF